MTIDAQITGRRFTFTALEQTKIWRLSQAISDATTNTPTNWRVQVVLDITEMHRIVASALERSDGFPPFVGTFPRSPGRGEPPQVV